MTTEAELRNRVTVTRALVIAALIAVALIVAALVAGCAPAIDTGTAPELDLDRCDTAATVYLDGPDFACYLERTGELNR